MVRARETRADSSRPQRSSDNAPNLLAIQRRQRVPSAAFQADHPRRGRFDDARCAVGASSNHGDVLEDYAFLLGVQLRDEVRHWDASLDLLLIPRAQNHRTDHLALLQIPFQATRLVIDNAARADDCRIRGRQDGRRSKSCVSVRSCAGP